jgi:four helix bundle protein
MSNVAEGFGRGGDKEFIQFLAVAQGSCGEACAQLYVAIDPKLYYASAVELISSKLVEIGRLVSGLMKYLRQSDLRGNKFK